MCSTLIASNNTIRPSLGENVYSFFFMLKCMLFHARAANTLIPLKMKFVQYLRLHT